MIVRHVGSGQFSEGIKRRSRRNFSFDLEYPTEDESPAYEDNQESYRDENELENVSPLKGEPCFRQNLLLDEKAEEEVSDIIILRCRFLVSCFWTFFCLIL